MANKYLGEEGTQELISLVKNNLDSLSEEVTTKQDILTAGDHIDISDNVISVKNAVLDALREKYLADPSSLNQLCFETETWQLYCLPFSNTIRDYVQINDPEYGTVTVDFGIKGSLYPDHCLSLQGIPLAVEFDNQGIGHLTLSLTVFGRLSTNLEILPYDVDGITYMDLPPTATELSDRIDSKQDKLQYYTEYESLRRGVEIRVADDERNGSYMTVNQTDINLNPTNKAYYNSNEIATVADLDTKQDVLTAGTNVAITSDNVISVNLNGYATKAQLSAVEEEIEDITTLKGLREKFPSSVLIGMITKWFTSRDAIQFAEIMDCYEHNEFSSCRIRFTWSTTSSNAHPKLYSSETETYIPINLVRTSSTSGYINGYFDLVVGYDKTNEDFYDLTYKYAIEE